MKLHSSLVLWSIFAAGVAAQGKSGNNNGGGKNSATDEVTAKDNGGGNGGSNGSNGVGGKNTDPGPRKPPADAPANANKEEFVKGKKKENPGKGKGIMDEEGVDSYTELPGEYNEPTGEEDDTMEWGGNRPVETNGRGKDVVEGEDVGDEEEDPEFQYGEEYYDVEYDIWDEGYNETNLGGVFSRRQLQNLATGGIGDFGSLDCNGAAFPSAAECEAGGLLLSSIVAVTGETHVPCGSCYKYDLGPEATLEGLNIIGKLYVPPNYKSTLHTPYVFVQGELEMSDTNPISPDNESMKIVLTGTSHVTFSPAESNIGVAGTPFNAGMKPFLVAGGKLTIRGWDASPEEGTATWAPLLQMGQKPRPRPDLTGLSVETQKIGDPGYRWVPETPLQPATTLRECPRQIINDDFTHGIDYGIWTTSNGVIAHNVGEGTIELSNIHLGWQGVKLDLTEQFLECPIQEGTTLIVSMRMKIDKEGATGLTPCGETNSDCPRLQRKVMKESGDRDQGRRITAGIIGQYGEWFTFSAVYDYDANEIGDDVIGHVFILDNFEADTKVSITEFVMEFPSEKSYPKIDDACNEVIVNGDAEDTDGNGMAFWPMESSNDDRWQPVVMEEVLEDGSVNKFYRSTWRKNYYESIRAYVVKGCFINGYIYTISMRLRISNFAGPLDWYAEFKGRRQDGSCCNYKKVLECPEQTEADGWVTCTANYLVDDYTTVNMGDEIWLQVIMNEDQDSGPVWATVDYDDISMKFSSGPADGLAIDSGVSKHWGQNADLHITSSTLKTSDSQTAVISEVVENGDGTSNVRLVTGIEAVISEKDMPGQGVEVALLSRNIKVVSEDGSLETEGGYVQVFHTPGITQVIEGVEFVGMGQQQQKNRFPLQFLYSGDVVGSSISRNSIRHSNHRCIVIDGSSNAVVSSNVAYDTAGNCYKFDVVTEDLLVIGNLASMTNNKIDKNNKVSGYSDDARKSFEILSSQNDYIGNVAAGSYGRGFWMYNNHRTYGEDNVDTKKGNHRRLAMRTFKDNKSHSNAGEGFAFFDFEQFFKFRDVENLPTFENVRSYRNEQYGIITNNLVGANFLGGFLKDNMFGMMIQRSDMILVKDMEIQGYQGALRDFLSNAGYYEQCSRSNWHMFGIRYSPRKWRTNEKDPHIGMRLRNVTLSDFDHGAGNCPASWPLSLTWHSNDAWRYVTDGHFDYVSSSEDVKILDSRDYVFNGCDASSKFGVNDLVITDIDGSLDPAGVSSGPSALVSNFPHMTSMFGSACTEYVSSCMAYCSGICLRTVSFAVEKYYTDAWKLVVTNANGDTMEIPSTIEDSDEWQFSYFYTDRRFSASLPTGTYTAEFIDDAGNRVWPTFVEEVWEKAPDCQGHAGPGDITFLEPEGFTCDDLFRKAGVDSYEPWVHTDPGLEIGAGLGMDGSNAIVTSNRQGSTTGVGQHIDSRCVDANVGKYFEFSAWMRLVDKSGVGSTIIDPNSAYNDNESPVVTLIERKYRNAETKEYMYYTEDRSKAQLARPYQASDWNLVHGLFRLDATPHLFVEIERAPSKVEFYVDNASLVPFECNPDEIVRNGDFEEDTRSKWWDTWGATVKLDMVSGYQDVGNALKASNRPDKDESQAQVISLDCVETGDRVAFQARVKFETGGQTVPCYPNSRANSERCSDFFLYTIKDGTKDTNRVAWVNADNPVDGWYEMGGVYVMDEINVNADHAKIYFDGAAIGKDVIVDDVQVKRLPKNCEQLILNPSFEEGAAFWSYIDKERSKLSLVPGAGGSGFALRSYDRNLPEIGSNWRGVRQKLDTRCFISGEEFSISAKFKLVNATSQEGVLCDTNIQDHGGDDQQCPHVVVYGWNCDQGDIYWRFWNQLPNFDWDRDNFNDFSADFVVDDRLASCEHVHVYIHRINEDWEIIMDDVQISVMGTEAPTSAPTPSPTMTDLTDGVTASPTNPPTQMPTVNTLTSCPPVGSPSVEVSAGPVMIERSTSLCILTKAVVDVNGTFTKIAPVARSYDGGDWEISAGEYATSLLYGQDFGDFTPGCQIELPVLKAEEKYFITSYSYSLSDTDTVARLLETATFGTTANDLATWGSGAVTKENAATWIADQMAKPATSHREFFRKRANPRFVDPMGIGISDHPCRGMSRWKKYAFNRKDGDLRSVTNYFEAAFATGDTYVTIKMNGHVRTVVDVGSVVFTNTAYSIVYNTPYETCGSPEEKLGGTFRLRMPDDSCQTLDNPLVNFHENSAQPEIVLTLPDLGARFILIDELESNGGEYILLDGLNDPFCNQLEDFTRETSPPVFGILPDGTWLHFDARLSLEENTLSANIPDGGGVTHSLTDGKALCANAPRTFLNEDTCSLSYSAAACGSSGTPNLEIELNAENLITLHNITGQYVYSTLGLPVRDFYNNVLESPCTPQLRSRFEIKDVQDCNPTALESETNATLSELITLSGDTNPFIRDIIFPSLGYSCGATDTTSLVEVEIVVHGVCYKRTHPEFMTVYDFSYWALDMTHPGNMVAAAEGEYNPIKKWMDIDGSVFLVYPSFTEGIPNHSLDRWKENRIKFARVGRFGDFVKFVDFPNDLRIDEVAEHFGESGALGGSGTVLCGSPFETSNDPLFGDGFDVTTDRDTQRGNAIQREYVWSMVSLAAEDQLRQRMAWALSQLLVVVRLAVGVQDSHTEAFLTYHDIFVRNAFGNYRDILKEISYSPLMAENLSYLQSKSAAYMWEEDKKISFADENFAREIMQLFSTGLYLLNLDGTQKLDESGKPIEVYSNDEIMSFARVWTGFDYQQRRGNVEEAWSGNRNDPMTIQAPWRDKFPKSDLTGGYIGDGYPLCVDLPSKMFLRKGASYRLMGASFMPQLMEDQSRLEKDETAKKFVLEAASLLKAKLCNLDPISNVCQYENTVTLDVNLNCTGRECGADTLRVVDAGEGIYYEYVRPPCVEQALYRNPQKVINRHRMEDASCANPLLPYASEACCSTGILDAERDPDYLYDVERVLFSTANSRCESLGKMSCDFNKIKVPSSWWKQGYFWTTDICVIRVKVNYMGQVAVVYEPEDYAVLHEHINVDNRNFFKVYWEGDYPKKDNEVSTSSNNCGNGACTSLVTGGCLCETEISVSRVFRDMPASVDDALSQLHIGAYDPLAYDEGMYPEVVTENGITAYNPTPGSFTADTVFEFYDQYNRLHRLKNADEKVHIAGAPEYTFRNAPSFMSVLNSEADKRDAYYETEAALDHYMYHDNTAPFVASRLIQRFTTSNPNPRYVKEVATAFRTGSYEGFGTGVYGDLSATLAAILLDPEARSVVLDADPFHGSLREPLLRVMALMRNLELKQPEGQKLLQLSDIDSKIGQMAHRFPSVFSFFLPEYVPDGRPGEASLVAPETMLMDMPKIVGLLNGMFSLVKYGLTRCNGGFSGKWSNCVEGDYGRANAYLSFSRPYVAASDDAQADSVVGELVSILTSGRLSAASKGIVKAAYIEKLPDADAALRLAVQLILTTPEFHTTNTVELSGEVRAQPLPPPASGVPYKAVVYVMFAGGCDSYNMLVPKTCTGIKDMYAEYSAIREEIALSKELLLEINASTSNQICEKFGVHPQLQAVQSLYNDGDLLFFANTGVLTKETDKENYRKDTETNLFSHNWMQRAAQRIDPLKEEDATGILGRIADALIRKGLNVGKYSIETNTVSLLGEPGVAASPFILSRDGVKEFNSAASSDTMDDSITALNEATTQRSGVFGDLWSQTLVHSLYNNDMLYQTLEGISTNVTFPTSSLGRKLEMVAKMIDSRDTRAVDADMFFLATGGWDTHSNVEENLDRLFADVDASFKAFADEMKVKNIWDNVVVIETSDFARTLYPNTGRGSDHGWGGNYMMFGGAVRGGQIAGTYPDQLSDEGNVSVGRGRMIPSTSWDAVFLPIAEWAGVESFEFDYVCPNRENFGPDHFFDTSSLFQLN